MMCPVVVLCEKRGVLQTNQTPLIDYSLGSLSRLGLEATVSAAISSWTRTHVRARTYTRMHTFTAKEDGEVMGEGAHLIGAASSLGS